MSYNFDPRPTQIREGAHVAAVGGLLGGEAVDEVLLVGVRRVGVAALTGRLLHRPILDEPRKQC